LDVLQQKLARITENVNKKTGIKFLHLQILLTDVEHVNGGIFV